MVCGCITNTFELLCEALTLSRSDAEINDVSARMRDVIIQRLDQVLGDERRVHEARVQSVKSYLVGESYFIDPELNTDFEPVLGDFDSKHEARQWPKSVSSKGIGFFQAEDGIRDNER
eukprot:COSAG02_NODE_38124_length_433_cov_0.658683_1_plen_118_part_00